MSTPGLRVLLIVNLHKPTSRELMDEIAEKLGTQDIEITICAFDGKPGPLPDGHFDIAFSLGGDGTVLFAARCMASRKIPIFPINLGTLGFIAAIHRTEWFDLFEAWRRGELTVSSRLMLEVSVHRAGMEIARHPCLNDVVVAASGISKVIRLDVNTDTVRLGRYRADGLIVATPTGSTAYSVAAGGPILDPEMEAMIINPICPFTLSNRPVVIPAHETVQIHIEEEQRSGVLLTVDGQIVENLEPSDLVKVYKYEHKAMLLACDRKDFYIVLRTKLNWSGGPDA
ncbi:NAD(+)/NADH kinase [Treponema sp.]